MKKRGLKPDKWEQPETTNDHTNFHLHDLPKVIMPSDGDVLKKIEGGIVHDLCLLSAAAELQSCLTSPTVRREDAAVIADRAVNTLVQVIHTHFDKHGCLKKRRFGHATSKQNHEHISTPPALRTMRSIASEAQKSYCAYLRAGAPPTCDC